MLFFLYGFKFPKQTLLLLLFVMKHVSNFKIRDFEWASGVDWNLVYYISCLIDLKTMRICSLNMKGQLE